MPLSSIKLNHQFWTVKVHVDASLKDRIDNGANFRKKIDQTLYENYPSPKENEMDKTLAEQVAIIESTCTSMLRLAGGKRRECDLK